jgi:hypothetical protein
MGHVGELLVVLLVSALAIVGLVWRMLHPGPPIRWLPRAPSYTFVAMFGVAYNAIVERSWWATGFCLGLAAAFRIGRWLQANRRVPQEVLVVGGALTLMLANGAWLLFGHPGVP